MSTVAHPKNRTHIWGRRFVWLVLSVLILSGISALLMAVFLNSNAGRAAIERQIASMSLSGQSVEIEGLKGSVFSRLEIESLTVSDVNGIWFVAENMDVSWRPIALLSKTLEVESLRAESVQILSRPIINRSFASGDPAIEQINLKTVELPKIALSDSVLGYPVQMQSSGFLRHGPGGGQTQLSISSNRGDRIDADLNWSSQLLLRGDAQVEGPPEGLLTGLLRLEPGQIVSASVKTDGPKTEIQADIDADRFAQLVIDRQDRLASVSGQLDVTLLPSLAAISPLFGGTAKIDAQIPLRMDETGLISVRAPRLELDAQGRRQDDALQVSALRLSLTRPLNAMNIDDGRVSQVLFDGEATLGESRTFSGRVSVRDLAVQNVLIDRLSGPLNITEEEAVITFDTSLTGQANRSVAKQADGAIIVASGAYDISDRRLRLSQANIEFPGLRFQGRGDVQQAETLSTALTGQYEIDTALFREGPSVTLKGRATASQTAQGPRMQISGIASRFKDMPDAIRPILIEPAQYDARLQFSNDEIRLSRARLTAGAFQLTGEGVWSDERLRADLDYALIGYETGRLKVSDLTGAVALSGVRNALIFDLTGNAGEFYAGESALSNVRINVDGSFRGGAMTAKTALTSDSDFGPLDLTGDVGFAEGRWDVSDLDGRQDALTVTGRLSGEGGDIAAVQADLRVSGKTSIIPAEAIEATVLLNDAQATLDATISGVFAGALQDTTVIIKAAGPRNAVLYDVSVEGGLQVSDIVRPLSAITSGRADLSPSSLHTKLTANLSVADQSFTGDVNLARLEAGWSGSMQARGLGGSAELNFLPGPDGGLDYAIETLSVPKLARLLARPATEGSVSGDGQFRFIDSRMQGTASLRFDGLRSPISDAPPFSVQLNASLINDELDLLMAAAESGLMGQVRVKGPLETRSQPPFLIYPGAAPLSGRADLQGAIGPLAEIFLSSHTDVAGQIETDITFTLPHDPEQLIGTVRLNDGLLEQGAIGLRLKDIAFNANLTGQYIDMPTFSAIGANGGALTGSGRLGLGGQTGSIDLRAENLRAISRREGQADLSGDLTLSLADNLLQLSGDLIVERAEINIARLPEGGLPTLDVDFGDRNNQDDEVESLAATVTNMDVRVRSGGRINVTGRGLDALMSLNARLQGAFDNPVVTGGMSIERGRFDFLSKRFEFQDSNITLKDDIMSSVIAFEAIRRTNDLTAVVEIGGTFERPEISLSSEPTLPDDEILSRILFGRSPTQLSAIEAARLAAALTQLSGGNGFDLFGSLENAVGLDTLEIDQNETGQAQLTTGKYLADNVYLEVRTAAEGTPGIAVEWQVRDNVALEAETVPNERERLSVQWKRDFD